MSDIASGAWGCTWTSIIDLYDSRYSNVFYSTIVRGATGSVVIIGLHMHARLRPCGVREVHQKYELVMATHLSSSCQSRR